MITTLKYTIFTSLLLALTACSGEISSLPSDLENSEGELTPCEIDENQNFVWTAPDRGYPNETLSFQSNIENSTWRIRHIESNEEFTHLGMLWQTSFVKVGTYSGELTSITACDKMETASFQFVIEAAPNVSVVINNGDAFTNINTLSLSMQAMNATEMLVSTGSACNNGVWQPFNSTTNKTITAANATNTYSVKFKLLNGIESSCVSDSIVHDNLPPVVNISQAPGNTTSTAANFYFQATDNASGIQSYHCQLNSSSIANCVSPKAYNVSVGQNQFRIFSIDKAGNTSQTIVHTWTVSNNTTPTPTPGPTPSPTPIPTPVPPQPPTLGNNYSCDGITKPNGAFDSKYTAMGDMMRVNPPSYFPYLRDATWTVSALKSTYNHSGKLTSIPFIIPTTDTSRYFKMDIIQLQPIANNMLTSVTSTKKAIVKITPCQNDFRKAYNHLSPPPANQRDAYLLSSCYSAVFNGRIQTEIVDNIEAHIASGKTSCPIVRGKKYYINYIVGDEGSQPGSNPIQAFDCKYSAGPQTGNIAAYCGVNLSFDLR